MVNTLRSYTFLNFILPLVFFGIVFPEYLLANEKENELALSLQKVIEIALQNNLDIIVERLNPKIRREDIIAENAFFDPALFADISINKSLIPSASAFASPDVTSIENRNFSIGLKQSLKLGTSYELTFASVRKTTNSEFSGLDPQFTSFIDFDFRQPLLKNFGLDLNTRKIRVSQNDRDISQKEFKELVIQTVSDIQNNYWDLVSKKDELKVKRQSLDLAKDLENRVKIQVEVGVLAPLEILQAQSEVAAREEAVIISEHEIKDLEHQIRLEVKEAVRAIQTNIKRVKVTGVSKRLAEEKLRAEESQH